MLRGKMSNSILSYFLKFEIYLFLAVCFILAPTLILAESEPPSFLSLEEMLELAEKNNPEIQAAKSEWKKLKAKVVSEKTLDKPTVAYENMYSGDEKNIVISQEFPFPGKLYLKGKIALKESLMAEETLKAKENEIFAKVKSSYAQYFLALKTIELLNENVELMRHFSKVAESKYATNKASQVDVLRTQIELSKMLNMLITLEQEKETAQTMLNTLVNQAPETPLGIPKQPSLRRIKIPYEKLKDLALKNRPELKSMFHHLHHSKNILRAAKLETLPDFMTQFRYRTAMNPAMDKTQDYMIGVSLPLWFWKQKADIESAASEEALSQSQFQTMKNMTLFEIKNLWVKVKAEERLVDLYQTSVIPQAESALKASLQAYQSDKINFLDLIDIQRNLLQFRLEYYQALAGYEESLSELERITGKKILEEQG